VAETLAAGGLVFERVVERFFGNQPVVDEEAAKPRGETALGASVGSDRPSLGNPTGLLGNDLSLGGFLWGDRTGGSGGSATVTLCRSHRPGGGLCARGAQLPPLILIGH